MDVNDTAGDAVYGVAARVESTASLMQGGLERLAVYCNPADKTWVFSAVCSCSGRTVGWNHDEKSWDCPCHGSRFDCYGKIIVRPAETVLGTVENNLGAGVRLVKSS